MHVQRQIEWRRKRPGAVNEREEITSERAERMELSHAENLREPFRA